MKGYVPNNMTRPTNTYSQVFEVNLFIVKKTIYIMTMPLRSKKTVDQRARLIGSRSVKTS